MDAKGSGLLQSRQGVKKGKSNKEGTNLWPFREEIYNHMVQETLVTQKENKSGTFTSSISTNPGGFMPCKN